MAEKEENYVENRKADQAFAQVCSELTLLHTKKNHDYGNAFGDCVQEMGPLYGDGYAIGIINSKVSRLKKMIKEPNWVKGEGIEDSLLDLASYSIMTLIEFRKLHGSFAKE